MIQEQWMESAYCRSHPDPDLWFPASKNAKESDRTILMCRLMCPVQRECANYALRADWPITGTWAGVFISHTAMSQINARVKLKRIAEGLEK